MKGRLLNDLANRLNCYISDLSSPKYRDIVLAEISGYFFTDYPPEEWEYSLSYTLDRPVKIAGADDLDRLLKSERWKRQ